MNGENPLLARAARKRVRLVLLMFAVASSAFPQSVTWSDQIAPIIYNNCTTCHRTGQVTPFTLMSYSDVKQHAPTVAAVTQTGYMPPWKPEHGWTAFRDERRLTSDQIALIQQWVASGMPQGDPSKAPALPSFTENWQLGTPDLVMTMPASYSVAPDGADIYRNFVLHTGDSGSTDRWVKAIELKPSARGAVHHVLFYSDTSGQGRVMDGKDGQPGFAGFGSVFTLGIDLNNPLALLNDPAALTHALTSGLGGWVPGTTPEFLPSGIAYLLPKGADLILQTHFHPDGKPETEQTTIGLYFTSAPPKQIVQVQAPSFFGVVAGIKIPANDSGYMVRHSFTLPVDVDAFSVSAHAHYLGKGTRLTATLPNGQVQVLLWIKDWDFNWQDSYIFKDLVPLPAGTRIDGELIYDNSTGNPNNPFSPPKTVSWGENSTDEMGSLILNVLPHVASDGNALVQSIESDLISAYLRPATVGSKPLFISAGVVDAASEQSTTVSPGKLVVLYGDRMGPNSQVLFDGTAAPLLYNSASQVTAIVPYAVDGKLGTQVVVKNGANVSDPVALPVAQSSPGIFSLNQSGVGQGAILNQDGVTVNSSAHPAPAGSIIVIYATGEGQTSPGGVDGKIASGPAYPKPNLPMTVNIGGLPAEVLYYGAAPSLVAGVMQVNARIPVGVAAGDAPVQVLVGGVASQTGITVSVK